MVDRACMGHPGTSQDIPSVLCATGTWNRCLTELGTSWDIPGYPGCSLGYWDLEQVVDRESLGHLGTFQNILGVHGNTCTWDR